MGLGIDIVLDYPAYSNLSSCQAFGASRILFGVACGFFVLIVKMISGPLHRMKADTKILYTKPFLPYSRQHHAGFFTPNKKHA